MNSKQILTKIIIGLAAIYIVKGTLNYYLSFVIGIALSFVLDWAFEKFGLDVLNDFQSRFPVGFHIIAGGILANFLYKRNMVPLKFLIVLGIMAYLYKEGYIQSVMVRLKK